MRILIVSDNHGDREILQEVLQQEKVDYSIHLGDSQMDEKWILKNFNYYVEGNNDFWYSKWEDTFNLGGLNFFICHGHTRGISNLNVTNPVKQIFTEHDLDVILYGHTHAFKVLDIDNKTVICPGALRMPRGPEGKGYCIITIQDGEIQDIEFKGK